MKNATIRVCLFAAGTLAFGQSAASSVEGKVVNAASGSPVKHATVSLRLMRSVPTASRQFTQSPGANTAETDEQGRFIFSNLAPGGYSLTAQHQRFLNPGQGRSARPLPVLMVGENQQMTGVVLRLEPSSVISGKILDADGEAIAGVPVFALRPSYRDGGRQLTPAVMSGPTIVSNDLGDFRIPGLAAGSYLVMAGTPRTNTVVYDATPPQEKPELAYTNTYYPGAADAGRATSVAVTAGAEVHGIDIKLVKTKAVSIRGQVIDPGASPDRRAMVSLVPRSAVGPIAGPVGSAVTLPGGAFRIAGVPPGSYQLVARRGNDEGRVAAAASVPVEVGDASPDAISVRVLPVQDIEGSMKSSQPARCNGGYVSLVDESGFNGVPAVRISNASTFTLKSVVPATYKLNVSSGGPCYVESVRFGGHEITDMRVKVDGVGPLEITTATSDASVAGKVTDAAGKPVEGALVTLLPKGAVGGRAVTSFTDRAGSFSVYGVRPGGYNAFAWESVDYESAQSPEFHKQFESSARSVAVEAGGRQNVDLTVIPASATGEPAPSLTLPRILASVEGQVVNAVTGAPLGAATVTLGTTPRAVNSQQGMTGATAPPPEATVETDEQGRFTFRSVEPDFYYISAVRTGFTSAGPAAQAGTIGTAMAVGNGQRIAGYTIKLAPQGVVAGKVADEFGEAAANLQAVLYRAEYVSGVRRMVRLTMATTDDLGKFRFAGMAAGSYYLAVMRSPQTRVARSAVQETASAPESGFGIVWYPNAAEAAGATPIVVKAAAEVPIEIVMRRTKVVTIHGTVADGEGGPVARATIGLTPRGLGTSTSIGMPAMRPSGEFEIANVPAGSYILSARAMQNGTPAAGSPRMAFLPVEVRDANIEGVRLRLTSGKQVRGTVKWEGGGMRAVSLSGSTAEGMSAWAQASPMDGTFTFPTVWPLPYTLDAIGLPAECYVKSIRYGGRDTQAGEIDFDGDGALEIVVSATAAWLDGVALDRQQRPASGATVMLSPADAPGRVLSIRADEHGAFHFGGLRPGNYRAYAWEGDATELSPEALAAFQAQATIELKEGARAKVQLAAMRR